MNLTRRELLLGGTSWTLSILCTAAQKKYPGISYRDYSHCLPGYIRSLAEEAYRQRNTRLEKLTSITEIEACQQWVRETFWHLVGGKPERTPLKTRSIESFERKGYRVEKLIYESRPNFHIPGNLYIPANGEPPFPGVLFQMGHSLNGKASSTYQRCCQGLAQLGFLVLAFDPMGQGERTYYPGDDGYLTRLNSADEEHTRPGRQMILIGDTSTRMQTWDAVRSLDVLASHPLVDPQRLASTGQSGGGTLTMLLSAVDDRLAAAAVSCGNTENLACADFNPPGSTDDAEQNLLDSGPLGFDRWDLLYPLAPKPLLVLVSDRDFFGTYSPRYLASGWEEYQKLARIYEVSGNRDHLAWYDTPLPHNLAYDMRLEIYNWFRRWLKHETEPIDEEPPTIVEEDSTLFVAPSGNMVRSFGGETPFSMNRQAANAIQPADGLLDLKQLLAALEPDASLAPTVLGKVSSLGCEVEAIEVKVTETVWLPAWLFLPKGDNQPETTVIVLEHAGRSVRWKENQLCQDLAAHGLGVCAPDVRGIGDLRPEYSRGSSHHAGWHHDEEQWAWASLMLGRPLVGQRVSDLLALIASLHNYPVTSQSRTVVAARGAMTVPAIFTAVLDRRIAALYLAGGLVSFRSMIETQDYQVPLANVVPELLRYTDLPDLLASIEARVNLAGTVDASGETLPTAAVRNIYRKATPITILPKAVWDTEALLRALSG